MIVALEMMAAAVMTVVYASLIEWFVHKVVYHRWFAGLHAIHHAEYSGAKFQQPGTYRSLQPWWLEAVVLGVHAPVCLMLGEHLGTAVGITAFVVLAVYAAGSNYLHTAIHRPRGRRIERTRWYRRLVARHLVHHVDPEVDFTIVSPAGDLILGTFREGSRGSEMA